MTEYQDYKYVMQDTGNLYLGAKFTCSELIENEDVPFKVKTILQRYIAADLDPETTLESLFYHMEPKGFVYEACKQLKIKIKYSVPVEKRSLLGKARILYQTYSIKLEKFAPIPLADKEKQGVLIQEIGISKLALMTFHV
ncbi:MAG: hypothetical protein E7293_01050 [Lachnospiraceae bacterium]|nr:hypothetical protein [Lachnospiraceae bacterium]